MNETPTSCSSGRLRSIAARIAAGVAAVAPTGVGCAERPGSYLGAVAAASDSGGRRGKAPPAPTNPAHAGQFVRKNVGWTVPLTLAPYSISTRNDATSPTRAASRSGDGPDGCRGDGSVVCHGNGSA